MFRKNKICLKRQSYHPSETIGRILMGGLDDEKYQKSLKQPMTPSKVAAC